MFTVNYCTNCLYARVNYFPVILCFRVTSFDANAQANNNIVNGVEMATVNADYSYARYMRL